MISSKDTIKNLNLPVIFKAKPFVLRIDNLFKKGKRNEQIFDFVFAWIKNFEISQMKTEILENREENLFPTKPLRNIPKYGGPFWKLYSKRSRARNFRDAWSPLIIVPPLKTESPETDLRNRTPKKAEA